MKRYLTCLLLVVLYQVALSQDDRIQRLSDELTSLAEVIPGLDGQVDFTLNAAPVHELLRAMAETNNLNINIRNLPNLSITNNFKNVTVKDVLIFLCREYSLEVEFINNILTVRPFYERVDKPIVVSYNGTADQLNFDLKNDTLAAVVERITRESGKNVLCTPEVRNQLVSGYVANLPFDVAVAQLARTNNLELESDQSGVYVFGPGETFFDVPEQSQQPAAASRRRRSSTAGSRRGGGNYNLRTVREGNDAYINLDAKQADIAQVINAVAQDLKVNYVVLEAPEGVIEGYFSKIDFDRFLAFATESAGITYGKKGDVYIIGSHESVGLAETTVYKFHNRSVEGVTEFIPSIFSNLEVSLLTELNALLIVGSEKDALDLIDFLEQIDEPIPNVLIEVIVTEINKGSGISTGVQAFLGDSVPNTSGQLFGGVDLTLSSASINSVLSGLDGRGIVNLGRVTPKFYATIQAMENNNNLNVRSTPKLSTLNGNEATLTIGQSVYFLIENQNVVGGVNPIVTRSPRYEKVEANLDIKITPFVSGNEDITLGIEAEFSDFIDPTIDGAPPGNATRKFISRIRIRNEEMIVLGGLEEVSKSETGSGVPLLSRIPVLKWIFSSKTRNEQNNKLLIFIKPTIVY